MADKSKKICKYGSACYRQNKDHLQNFTHPDESEPENDSPPRAKRQKQVTRKPKKKPDVLTRKLLEFMNEVWPETNQEVKPAPKRKPTGKAVIRQLNDEEASLDDGSHGSPSADIEGSSDNPGSSICEDGGICDVTSNSWTFTKSPNVDQSSLGENSTMSSGEEGEDEEFDGKTAAEKIKYLFLVDMPQDFYSLYEFCETLDAKNPCLALGCELRLIGPYDVVTGALNPGQIPRDKALCHWRFYLDPPEMQTVVVGRKGAHFGYWRDDLKEQSVSVVRSDPPDNCIKAAGPNIFSALCTYLSEYSLKCNPFEKTKVSKVLSSMKKCAKDNNFVLEDKEAVTRRKRKSAAATFHGFGIVVPVDSKTEVGYRPLIESYANIRRICKTIINARTPQEREDKLENLQPLVNAANIANDECDFGNGLELGLNLFCTGSFIFHKTISHLLTTAYSLLDRPELAKIIKAHLKWRRPNMEPSALPGIGDWKQADMEHWRIEL